MQDEDVVTVTCVAINNYSTVLWCTALLESSSRIYTTGKQQKKKKKIEHFNQPKTIIHLTELCVSYVEDTNISLNLGDINIMGMNTTYTSCWYSMIATDDFRGQ